MLQWIVRSAPGNTGQASRAWSQTVMTHAYCSPRNRVNVFECWSWMSMPCSAMTRIASGRTNVASVPALATSKRSPAQARNRPSAIWDRALLCVQMTRMRGRFIEVSVRVVR